MMYHDSIIVSNAINIRKTSLLCSDPRSLVFRIESPYRVTTRREPSKVLCWLLLVGVQLVAHPLVVGVGPFEVAVEFEPVAEPAEPAGQAGRAGRYTGVNVVGRD